jgi:type I restriction enzyme, S subunit
MSWPKLRLESLAAKEPYSFVGGPFGSKLTTRDYVESGIPVIRGSNMNNGRYLDMGDFVFVTESKVREDLSSNLAKPGDLVFTQRGTLGQVAIIPSDGIADRYVVSQSQMKLTVDEARADRLFLYYFFSSREATERIMSFVSSSGVPHINLTVLRNFEVPVPPPENQRNIARILSAYDDLIENNRRRIQLLEQAARLLYKEWFVHLRFPGHEHSPIINGVPEGWKNGYVGDLATVKSGFAFKSKDWQQDGNPVIKIKNITGDGTVDTKFSDYINDTVAEKATNFIIPVGALLIAMTGATVGKVGILCDHSRIYYLNQRVGLFKSITSAPAERILFPFFQESKTQTQVINLAGGAAQPNISGGQIESIKMLIPDNKILDLYFGKTKAVFEQRQNLLDQNEKLTKARDLLLPKLMNGEVAV